MGKEELIFKYFDFLLISFCYKRDVLIKYMKTGIIVVVYENIQFKKKIEISISENGHNYLIIRYFINGKWADYDNKLYCIDMNVLSQLKYNSYETNDNFYSFDNTVHYFEKSCKLLLDYKSFLSSDAWIDTTKYVEIMDNYWMKRFGSKYDINRISIQQEFENELISSFPNMRILYNSEKQPPYNYLEGWNTAKYEINGHLIVFHLPDWRDYNQYDVTIDNIGGYLINTLTDYKKKIKEIVMNIERRCCL
ncbi:hypothetical protein [Viscerimonas tarda]